MADGPRDPGWADPEAEQRRAWLRLTPRQRLDWLWEARSFAIRAEEARRARSAAGPAAGPAARPPERALETVRAARAGAVQTFDQERFVSVLAERWRSGP